MALPQAKRDIGPDMLRALAILLVMIAITGYMTLRDGITLSPVGAVILYPLFAFGVTAILAALLRLEAHLQPLRWTGAGFIAAISYSLYLSHKLVVHADKALLPKAWLTGWSGVAICYVPASRLPPCFIWQ
jgi:peptidoglycan/LPS O-acetylase OafA/YrhL